jgi:hypothetical protein
MNLRYFIAIVALAAVGCQTIAYKEPLSGDRARVRLASQAPYVVVVRAYDDASCETNEQEWMRLRSGYLVNSSPKRLGLPLWHFHDNGAKEVFIDTAHSFHALIIGEEMVAGRKDEEFVEKANSLLVEAIEFSPYPGVFQTTYRCGVAFSFDFKANVDYEVEYIRDRQFCSVVVSQIDGGETPSLKRLATFGNRVKDSAVKCNEAFKKKRLF